MEIYQPAEDSFLLSGAIKEFLKNKSKDIKILDMGSGSGIQAKTSKELGFENITIADINPDAIKYLKKQGFKAIKTNLFSHICGAFNLIIFNPPYLPEDEREPLDSRVATTAGKEGYEIILKFLEQARFHLLPQGEILLLFSSLSQPSVIKKKAKELGYTLHLLKKSSIPFERLYVYELIMQSSVA